MADWTPPTKTPVELREAAGQHIWRADYLREQADQHDRDAARLLAAAAAKESGGSK